MKNPRLIRNRYVSWAIRIALLLLPIWAIFIVPYQNRLRQEEQSRLIKEAYAKLAERGQIEMPPGGIKDVKFMSHHGGSPMNVVFQLPQGAHKTRYFAFIQDGYVKFKDSNSKEVIEFRR